MHCSAVGLSNVCGLYDRDLPPVDDPAEFSVLGNPGRSQCLYFDKRTSDPTSVQLGSEEQNSFLDS